jgi:hypothetical protein
MLKKYAFNLLILAIFALGLLIRLYDLTNEPLEAHPTRQLRAALIAHALYVKENSSLYSENDAALAAANDAGLIEPHVQDSIAVLTYRIAGQEFPWLGRLV